MASSILAKSAAATLEPSCLRTLKMSEIVPSAPVLMVALTTSRSNVPNTPVILLRKLVWLLPCRSMEGQVGEAGGWVSAAAARAGGRAGGPSENARGL